MKEVVRWLLDRTNRGHRSHGVGDDVTDERKAGDKCANEGLIVPADEDKTLAKETDVYPR